MATGIYEPVLTVSATYGAGGSVIAPRLAELLGLAFIDRAISAQLSEDAAAAARSEEGLRDGEETAGAPVGRILSYFARAASVGALVAPNPIVDDQELLRERGESALKDVIAGAGAVVLGRAGAVVLASRPLCYHVRLDGPLERRLRQAAQLEHIDLERAKARQAEADKARTLYVKRIYRADPADPRWYHLVMDTTVIPLERAAQLIASAAQAFFEAAEPHSVTA